MRTPKSALLVKQVMGKRKDICTSIRVQMYFSLFHLKLLQSVQNVQLRNLITLQYITNNCTEQRLATFEVLEIIILTHLSLLV